MPKHHYSWKIGRIELDQTTFNCPQSSETLQPAWWLRSLPALQWPALPALSCWKQTQPTLEAGKENIIYWQENPRCSLPRLQVFLGILGIYFSGWAVVSRKCPNSLTGAVYLLWYWLPFLRRWGGQPALHPRVNFILMHWRVLTTQDSLCFHTNSRHLTNLNSAQEE